ncbi:phosphoglycolate phosphatase [Stenotrophomonas sp. SY1]|uniref:phosphoglycolate phosphatase n=1 Tax=Stenotrophomonas sp. SY1 TaxID=477235 RepID=UPI001E437EC7|nr:phosphoglycolate phosphatase [Stenotrophomonas sp. SY1]MCD9085852.1 phosphoglycolate phosphatase [Stenotrophomonas sp. SY1]
MATSAVVFDLDGTLVDSAGDIAEAVNRTLEDLALPRVSEATVRSWIGEGVRNLVATALRHAGSDRTLDTVMPTFMRHYHDCLLRSPRLYDGVTETLHALQLRGLPMAICTNKPVALVPPLLEHLGIAAFFAHIIGGDSLPQRKPSAEPLQHVAALLGQPVQACLMVGDSATDLHAANNAGMPIVLVRYGYPRDLDLDAADAVAVIDVLPELLGHIA